MINWAVFKGWRVEYNVSLRHPIKEGNEAVKEYKENPGRPRYEHEDGLPIAIKAIAEQHFVGAHERRLKKGLK